MKCEETILFSKEDVPRIAMELLQLLKKESSKEAVVLALSGDLGAGKTALVSAIGKQLGISEPVVSPTFTIMKLYETKDDTFTQLFHMDAYRIESTEELRPLAFQEYLGEPQTLFCIEWPEHINAALPAGYLHLSLTIIDETTRTATLSRKIVNSPS